jgi:hypothetical protein
MPGVGLLRATVRPYGGPDSTVPAASRAAPVLKLAKVPCRVFPARRCLADIHDTLAKVGPALHCRERARLWPSAAHRLRIGCAAHPHVRSQRGA